MVVENSVTNSLHCLQRGKSKTVRITKYTTLEKPLQQRTAVSLMEKDSVHVAFSVHFDETSRSESAMNNYQDGIICFE